MDRPADLRRRQLLCLLGLLPLAGCASLWTGDGKTSSHKPPLNPLKSLAEKKPVMPERVGEAARPVGLHFAKIEAVGIVNGLRGTGGKTEPGRQRDDLINEIRTHINGDVNEFVDSPDTAMVIVQAVIPPAVRDGETVDLVVKPSRRTVATSFREGWLMPVRLREMRVLEGNLRTSDVLGTGNGAVITRWDIEGGDDPQKKLEGIIVGGGKLMKGRQIGLTLRRRPDAILEERVAISTAAADAINERFSFFDGLRRRGVANAKTDEYIELAVHESYQRSIHRYLAVIDRIPIQHPTANRSDKLRELATQLMTPATAADAALTLEAYGKDDAIDTLRQGLASDVPLVRFVSAETLAFLESQDAIPVLMELAKQEPSMRYSALRALGIHPHHSAADALAALLHEQSNETRYGALRELRERPDFRNHLAVRTLPGGIEMVLIPTTAPPLIAVSTSRRQMIALFGAPITVRPSSGRVIGEGLTLRGDDQGRLRISHFKAHQDDQLALAPPTLEGVLEGLCQVGVDYGSIVATLRQLKEAGDIDARLAFDPLPKNDDTRLEATVADMMDDAEESQSVDDKTTAKKGEKKAWWDTSSWFDD